MVVGAGPAGTVLALQLARAGVAVELIEASQHHQKLLRGDGLMPSGLEALDRLALGDALETLPQRSLRSWDFWVEQRSLFAVAEPMGGRRPCTLINTGSLLETLLQEARRHPSFTWRAGRSAEKLRFADTAPDQAPPAAAGESGRVVGVVLDDGTALEADLVVACDGRGSLLRRRAGLGLKPNGSAVEVLWFELPRQASADLEQWVNGRFLTLLGEEGSLALFTTAAGGLRVGWLQQSGSAASSQATWPERWARISPPDLAALWRALPAESIDAPLRLLIRPALAERWHRPGLLLLGDAAHPLSPLRAQGLNMALRDALVAAEQLVPVLQEGASPSEGRPEQLARLDRALADVERLRRPEILRIQALQQQELNRARLLLGQPWLRRLLAATARWSGPLLARRWQAGQPTLRDGLPLPRGASMGTIPHPP